MHLELVSISMHKNNILFTVGGSVICDMEANIIVYHRISRHYRVCFVD